MTNLEITLAITSGLFLCLFLGAVIYNSMIGDAQIQLYTTYKVAWKVAEQDNKWLRILCEVQGKKLEGPKLGEQPDQVDLDTQEDE